MTADEVDKLQKKFNELRDSFDRAVKLQLLLDSGSIARDLKVIIGRLDEGTSSLPSFLKSCSYLSACQCCVKQLDYVTFHERNVLITTQV